MEIQSAALIDSSAKGKDLKPPVHHSGSYATSSPGMLVGQSFTDCVESRTLQWDCQTRALFCSFDMCPESNGQSFTGCDFDFWRIICLETFCKHYVTHGYIHPPPVFPLTHFKNRVAHVTSNHLKQIILLVLQAAC